VGFLVDLDSGVGATVDFVVTMTADSGGPWTFGYSLPVALPAAPSAAALLADVNRDGVVGIADILTIATVLGEDATTHPRADLNGDQVLDIADMVVVEVARQDSLVGAPSTRSNARNLVDKWLHEARDANDGSPLYRDGIDRLVGMLATLRPDVTTLLPNYPNPFNPETWIPFDLAAAADVTVTIYDMQGRVVRRVDLGRRDIGSYRSRRDAAHWDGANEVGEPVASGVYVYELRAGAHREARRMVIRK